MADSKQLRELAEVTAGPAGSQFERLSDGPVGVPVITPANLTEWHTVDTRRLRRLPETDAGKIAHLALREGDVLLVRQGSLGRLALVGAEHATWLYNSSCLRIRPRPELILPAYLASYLAHPPVRRRLLAQALPGTVPSFNVAMLNELPVAVPTMAQQLAVVDVLADIDAQVGIQRRMADRLAALKPAIFAELVAQDVRPA